MSTAVTRPCGGSYKTGAIGHPGEISRVIVLRSRDTVYVRHMNAQVNCGAIGVSGEIELDGGFLTISEESVYDMLVARCNCLLDVEHVVTGLYGDQYLVKVHEPGGPDINSLEITVDFSVKNPDTVWIERDAGLVRD